MQVLLQRLCGSCSPNGWYKYHSWFPAKIDAWFITIAVVFFVCVSYLCSQCSLVGIMLQNQDSNLKSSMQYQSNSSSSWWVKAWSILLKNKSPIQMLESLVQFFCVCVFQVFCWLPNHFHAKYSATFEEISSWEKTSLRNWAFAQLGVGLSDITPATTLETFFSVLIAFRSQLGRVEGTGSHERMAIFSMDRSHPYMVKQLKISK